MRFKITLCRTSSGKLLPINYQYELSAWLLKVIDKANPKFSRFLHDEGYKLGKRRFKLYTFSNFDIPSFKIDKERQCLVLLSDEISLEVSFFIDEAAESFIRGLFIDQRFGLGNRDYRVDFEVRRVEASSRVVFTNSMFFKALSPITVSSVEERNGKLTPQYITPEDERFEKLFFDNLINKYIAASQALVEQEHHNFAKAAELPLRFLLKGTPRSKLIAIKANTPAETKVKGFLFDFEIEAPAHLIEFGYYAGFGEKNAMGFGCVGEG